MIRFATELACGRPIEVHKGSARGWLHASDAVRALERTMDLEEYEVINIGSPDIRSISELAELVRATLGADPALVHEVGLPGRMTLTKVPNLSKQEHLLGVVPEVSLEDGVKLVCDAVQERLARQ